MVLVRLGISETTPGRQPGQTLGGPILRILDRQGSTGGGSRRAWVLEVLA